MSNIDFEKLYKIACETINPRELSEDASSGGVAAALLTNNGNIYKGVCIDTGSSMGFCAEHAAAAAMITAGESNVVGMVAVNRTGKVYPPCGRCREFISQINSENINADVMVGREKIVKLCDLLPYHDIED